MEYEISRLAAQALFSLLAALGVPCGAEQRQFNRLRRLR